MQVNGESLKIKLLDIWHYSSKDILQDSNIHIHDWLFKNVYSRPEYFTVMVVPDEHKDFFYGRYKADNVFVLPIKYYSTEMGFRIMLDYKTIIDKLSNFLVDVVICHNPEIVPNIWSCLLNAGSTPKFINWTHWLPHLEGKLQEYQELEDYLFLSAYKVSAYNNVESVYKKLALNKTFYDKNVPPVLFTVYYPQMNFVERRIVDKFGVPTFFFNHRANEYTGYSLLKKVLDFYDSHYDLPIQILFSKISANSGTADAIKPEYKHITITQMDEKSDYFESMAKCHYELGFHNGKSGFSVAFVEGLTQGLLPFYYDGVFFPEIFEGYPQEMSLGIFKFRDLEDVSGIAERMNLLAKQKDVLFTNNVPNKPYDSLADFIRDKFNKETEKSVTTINNEIKDSFALFSNAHGEKKIQELGIENLPDVLSVKDFSTELLQNFATRNYNSIARNLVENYGYTEHINKFPLAILYTRLDKQNSLL